MEHQRNDPPGGGFDPLQVSLPYFDGPLDLLLHLVRKQELDINELRLAELTEPYLAYVERMRELNLDQAGEFLSIAATLIWIKSRSLLPREATADEDEPDPETVEEMLLLRLREYQRFKDAAVELTGRDLLGRDVFPRQAPPDAPVSADAPVVEEASLFSLLEAFRAVLQRAANLKELHIVPDEGKVEEKIDHVLALLELRQALYFDEFFAGTADRAQVVLTFIAVLELTRLKALRLSQAGALGAIHCRVTDVFLEAGEDYKRMILESLFGTRAPRTSLDGDVEAPADTEPEPA